MFTKILQAELCIWSIIFTLELKIIYAQKCSEKSFLAVLWESWCWNLFYFVRSSPTISKSHNRLSVAQRKTIRDIMKHLWFWVFVSTILDCGFEWPRQRNVIFMLLVLLHISIWESISDLSLVYTALVLNRNVNKCETFTKVLYILYADNQVLILFRSKILRQTLKVQNSYTLPVHIHFHQETLVEEMYSTRKKILRVHRILLN